MAERQLIVWIASNYMKADDLTLDDLFHLSSDDEANDPRDHLVRLLNDIDDECWPKLPDLEEFKSWLARPRQADILDQVTIFDIYGELSKPIVVKVLGEMWIKDHANGKLEKSQVYTEKRLLQNSNYFRILSNF